MQDLSEFINATMQQWKVPGLAIALVKDSEVMFCEGFGLRDIKNNLKVTPQTLFAIGSCTKAFTTMAMSILVDRGKLDWDKPVRYYLPTFKLHDSYATERMTLRDLVTHRSGLPRHDAMWYNAPFSRQELFDRLQYLEPTHELRTVFQYQNLMYMTAGYLVGEITGSSWEKFIQQEIFQPLEMKDSNFSVKNSQEAADFALPYQEKDDEVKEIPFRNIDAIGPAGSINSNITDMVKWLLLLLNQGKFGEKQMVSLSNLTQLLTPQMMMPESLEYPEILHPAYGLGWIVSAYRGHNFIEHGGGIDGFSALTTLLPQDQIGVVVLTNKSGTPLPSIVTYYACDRLLGLDIVPWNERIQQKFAQVKEVKAKIKEKVSAERKTGTQPSHFLKDYTGQFEHPAYGIISVELKDDHLTTTFNSIVSHLQHHHYDIFESISEELFEHIGLLSFFTDTRGNINSLAIPLEPALKDIIFTRIPEKRMLEKSFLEKFTGEYELFEQTLRVSLREDQLIVSVAGQPEQELFPYQESEFNFKNLSGFSIKFTQASDGMVTEAVITQPNGVFTATKKL